MRIVTGPGAASYTVIRTGDLHFASEPADVFDTTYTLITTPSSAPRIDSNKLSASAAPIHPSTTVAAHVVTPAFSSATNHFPPLLPTYSQFPN